MIHTFLSVYPFTVCLFWTAVFLLEWRSSNPAKRILTSFMLTCTVLYFCHALFFNGLSTPYTDSLYDFCNVAVYPLYLIYIYRLTGRRPLPRTVLLLLTPAVLAGISGSQAGSFPPAAAELRALAVKAVFILQILFICWTGLRRLRRFDRQIENFFSNTEQRSVHHTRNMMTALTICSCLSATASLIGRELFFTRPSLLFIPSLLFGSLLFVVGFVGQKQVFCADDLTAPDTAEDDGNPDEFGQFQPQGSPAAAAAASSPLLQALESLMLQDELYLQPDLRLSEVASLLCVSRNTLSAAINQGAGVSFSDYVNAFRVRHAQDIMRNQPQASLLSVIQIAEQSGFTSESSFYRAFRKYSGLTPRQWLHR